jgi:hypothetical protein
MAMNGPFGKPDGDSGRRPRTQSRLTARCGRPYRTGGKQFFGWQRGIGRRRAARIGTARHTGSDSIDAASPASFLAA